MELQHLWKTALGDIEVQISRPNFVTWFTNSQLIEQKKGVAIVALPSSFAKEWIENKYYNIVLGALRNLDENTKKVEFLVRANIDSTREIPQKQEVQESFNQLPFSDLRVDPETNLNPRYTLDSFVVGSSNELAYAAAAAIVADPGAKYNPLFVYGGVGLGKTHLMQAIGNEIRTKYHSKVRVKYVSSERFTNDVIWAIRNKRTETIKQKYRLVDVLIIDDIQFIAGKPATEEEFFHTFNALHEHDKQLIISSDQPPRFLPTLEERLRSRFEGGMIVDIGQPDYELRCAIINTKAQNQGIQLSNDVVSLIAHKIQRNLRELEGVLNRILFYQNRKVSEITIKVAETIINETIQEPSYNINPNQIIKAVSEFSDIPLNDLLNRSRKKEVAEARQIAMYLLRDMLSLSYPFIGKRLGKRDHTTAIYACEKIAGEISHNPALGQKIMMIKDLINKG
ncbi:MAG: chromosomal replication initiator protein DnaA [Candidatus Harrisonbacteria bacterium CG10_big_fil_rev_8_21_14_0_10_42_17]|uniref:Chromosomal replication initiator protein DnaA n=1 Tax=Candidatus Harrisonbacteria bacterium CG10_big_fil_rev_8_21_14_0_10_42_17 TaxID=1974584 RepID=A0A2M6WIX7_9BACT|nr:MAG: chromosomal replication initiator protein DnaA [Candidatus Harrisonbacteria bacterium CG10_big_fil_rev_8_21_14_0_10_42_17]